MISTKPCKPYGAGLVFLTPEGLPLVRENIDLDVAQRIDRISAIDSVSHVFGQFRDAVFHCACGKAAAIDADGTCCLSCRAELVPIRRLGMYTGRHTAITAASGAVDADAVHRWRGHSLPGMSSTYIEEIEVPRLRAVAERLLAKMPGVV